MHYICRICSKEKYFKILRMIYFYFCNVKNKWFSFLEMKFQMEVLVVTFGFLHKMLM